MKKKNLSRFLSALLAVVMLTGILPVSAAEPGSNGNVRFEVVDNSEVSATLPLQQRVVEETQEQSLYNDTDMVRVSIMLTESPVIELYSTTDISENTEAMNYRRQLETRQDAMAATISEKVLGGKKLDVVWNLNLITNMISANVRFGQIAAIEAIPGVESVTIEECYEPMVVAGNEETDPDMATSGEMIGSMTAYLSGYTGAGSRVAVIDTGIDDDHQSFSGEGLEYSLSLQAERLGMSYEDYIAGLNLMDTAEIASKLDQLHISKYNSYVADDLYHSTKIAYAYNYVDRNLDINHDNDKQGGHGSHVIGIAAANAYVPNKEGGFTSALEGVFTQGVAPDAQIISMKVFGTNGGAYPSDYMVAIEDAIILGATSVNLSLGSGGPGYSTNSNAVFQGILDNLSNTETVATMSAGNSGGWADSAYNMIPYMYGDDISIHTGGSPGSFTNSVGTASVNNVGRVGEYFRVDDSMIIYNQSAYKNQPLTKLAGEQEYVLITGLGTEEEFAALADVLEGRIAACSRGELGFFEKANNAMAAGAAGLIIYNNQAGTINMDLSAYTYTNPVVSVTQAEGALMRNAAERMETEGGAVYYLGTMTISEGKGIVNDGGSYVMSDFSSWGVPGSLKMKPDITAPGGNIYSIDGVVEGGQGYMNNSGTSMAAPQIAGMAAIVAQYIRENQLDEQTGLSVRALTQSLLMSTAEPIFEDELAYDHYNYYSVLRQAAGLANVGNAVNAESYILMGEDATESYADGKVKAELGDDPDRTGEYSFTFSINNLTDEELSYQLSADLFTQDKFLYYTNPQGATGLYMDTWTASLDSYAFWFVNGELLLAEGDYDGDGYTSNFDVNALLEYITGESESIEDLDLADIDGDGVITTYDAYLFLQQVNEVVSVPANGSVEIEVVLVLSSYEKDYLDSYYETGAYIEGYVYATPIVTPEGAVGVEHSIPVLGFYGNWTDPSMYEVGTWTSVSNGIENRLPYTGVEYANYVTAQYASEGKAHIYFGGNPVFYEEYKPERNALNSVNGDKLSQVGYTLIRNAISGQVTIEREDGAVVYKNPLNGLAAAYYHVNSDAWQNTGNRAALAWDMQNVKEGESYIISMSMATEYDLQADGSIDWDALGEGATLSLPFVIDNTAPLLEDIEVGEDEIFFTVSDNQYMSCIAIATADGTEYIGMMNPEQEVAGEVMDVGVDGSDLEDGVYLLQIYDYAMNCTTYRIFFNVEPTNTVERVIINAETVELVPGELVMLQATVLPANLSDDSVVWSTSDSSVAVVNQFGGVTAVAEGTCTITATALLDNTKSDSCEIEVITIDTDLNGILWNEEAYVYWTSFNTATLPAYSRLHEEDSFIDMIAATYDENGVLYGVSLGDGDVSTLYKIDPANGFVETEIGTADGIFYADITQAPNLDVLLGVYGHYVVLIDKETGDYLGAFSTYSGSTLAGITYAGSFYEEEDEAWADMFFLVDTDGNVYIQAYILIEDTYYYYMSKADSFMFNTGADVTTVDMFNSIYYDGEYLYWSAYDRNDDVAKLFAINVDTGDCHPLGDFGKSVWPVAGLFELGNYNLFDQLSEEMALPMAGADRTAAIEVNIPERVVAVSGGLDAATTVSRTGIRPTPIDRPNHADNAGNAGGSGGVVVPDPDPNPNVITFDVIAKVSGEEVATHNGKMTILYDDEALVFEGANVYADFYSINASIPGEIVIAYAGLDVIPAGEAVAHIFFDRTASCAAVSIFYEEANNILGMAYGEVYIYGVHEDLEHVPYLAPTTTESGNIEYWYCPDCNQYFADENCENRIENTIIYGITFDANGGTVTPGSGVTNTNGKLESLPTPTNTEFFVFKGWYTAAEGGEKVTLDTVYTANTTIYAQWTQLYLITFEANGGTVTPASGVTNIDGKLESLPTPTRNGYSFTGWFTAATGGTQITTATIFTDNTTIYAQWNQIPSGGTVVSNPDTTATTYTVTFNTNGGSEIANQTVTKDKTATEPAAPTREGFTFVGWYTDEDLTTAYDFTKAVTANITLYAKWVEDEAPISTWDNPFSDVAEGIWYYEAVQYVNENGIMNGMGDGSFSPNASLTRAMMVQIFYNLEGNPAAGTANFNDVALGSWYYNPVAWAANNGIVNGMGGGLFAPNGNITREQMAVMLYNYCEFKGIELPVTREDGSFNDANAISDWAVEAVEVMYQAEILNGRTDGSFDPKGTATRAEVATMLARFVALITE